MKYIRGKSNYKIWFGDQKPMLVGNTDVDTAGQIDSRKSLSEYLFTFAGELFRDNLSCKNVLHSVQYKLNLLL
jgi:hypothetical protein